MLDPETLNKFIRHANVAHQQFCVWFHLNNNYAKHQTRWNATARNAAPFPTESFDRSKGCKYKNFWGVIVPTLQHSWILSSARLFDPAYNTKDKNKKSPRVSLDYILSLLGNYILEGQIRSELMNHSTILKCLKEHRHNRHAHNDANFNNVVIEPGIENLLEWLEQVIERIKSTSAELSRCGNINTKYNEKLSQCGVEEVFDTLLVGEAVE